ncbi:MAG: acyltransferase [bacterium]|nr:acyltransferase [bacterium]
MYLRSLEYFRGLAIVFIVAGHCYILSEWQFPTVLERSFANVLTAGTALFVFISGFLFHHVFYPRFHYKTFMTKKLWNVLAPYLFFSLFGITYALTVHGPYPEFFFGPGDSWWDRLLRPALLYLLTGAEVWAYWYIPFIMIVFALSPLFILYIRASLRTRLSLFIALLLFAMFLQRPLNNLLVAQSVFFYTPVYLAGILASQNRQQLHALFDKREGWLLAGAGILALVQAYTYTGAGSMHAPPFAWNGLDINILQKLLLSLFFMLYLYRFENKDIPLLSALAQASFAIFFIHCWIILALIPVVQPLYKAVPLHPFPALVLNVLLVLFLSYLPAASIKRLLPNISKILIGW